MDLVRVAERGYLAGLNLQYLLCVSIADTFDLTSTYCDAHTLFVRTEVI